MPNSKDPDQENATTAREEKPTTASDDDTSPPVKKRIETSRHRKGPEVQRRPPKTPTPPREGGPSRTGAPGRGEGRKGGPSAGRTDRPRQDRSDRSDRSRNDRSDRPDRSRSAGPGRDHRDGGRGDSRRDGGRDSGGRPNRGGPPKGRPRPFDEKPEPTTGGAQRGKGWSPDNPDEPPPTRVGGTRNEHGTRVARHVVCSRCGAHDHVQWVEQDNSTALCKVCAEEMLGVLELGRKEKQKTRDEICNLCGIPFAMPDHVEDDGDPLCGNCLRGFMAWQGTIDRTFDERQKEVSISVRPGLRVRRRDPDANLDAEPPAGDDGPDPTEGAAAADESEIPEDSDSHSPPSSSSQGDG